MGESDPETAESLNTFGSVLLLSGQPEASRLHLDVWIIQQLREAFAHDAIPRYLVFDNDKKYGTDVLGVIVLNERVVCRDHARPLKVVVEGPGLGFREAQ